MSRWNIYLKGNNRSPLPKKTNCHRREDGHHIFSQRYDNGGIIIIYIIPFENLFYAEWEKDDD